MTAGAPKAGSAGPAAPKRSPRDLLSRDAARNALGLGAGFATFLLAYLLDMDTLMAVLLGLLVGARVIVDGNRRAERAVTIAILAWAILLPTQLDEGGGLIDDLNIALAYVVMALGLNIVVGFAGLLDLGYVAFFAIGAYTMGWFGSGFFADAGGDGVHLFVTGAAENLPGIHMTFLLVAVFAVIFTALAGAIIGLPTLRLRGDYIAIVTLAFGEIVGRVAINGDEIKLGAVPVVGGGLDSIFGEGAKLTNGRQGITPVDKLQLPGLDPFQSLNLRPWYWVALAMVLIILFVNFRLRDSRLGRAWVAVREDEVAAASMGVPLVRTKLLAYATGAAFGGVSGGFLASYLNTVNADQFQFSFSIFVLAMIILGGLGSIWGVVVGAIALSFINNRLIPDVLNDAPSKVGLEFDLTELSFAIFGFLLVIMMVLRPEGLLPERRRKLELTEGVGAGETIEIGGASDVYETRA
jgi:branched-chain amino acid transport system permease protein